MPNKILFLIEKEQGLILQTIDFLS